jgi:uncharacterized membrane protein
MAIGPVQLVVLGFDRPDFEGEIIAELERLRESDTVRVIDALAVYKKSDSDVEVGHFSNLTTDEAVEMGSMVGALVGIGIGADAGPDEDRSEADDEPMLDDADVWDVLEEIPPDSAAALILLEHHWAVPLRDAVVRAGGFRIADGFVSPRDLVAFGMHTSAEAERLEALERPGVTTAP